MSLPLKTVLGILLDNVDSRQTVLRLPSKRLTGWADGLGLSRGGGTIIYTGHMYQLMPSVRALSHRMGQFRDSWMTRFSDLIRPMNRLFDLSRLVIPSAAEQRRYDAFLRNITLLLRQAGLEFGYLYEQEPYAGTLVFDQGFDDVFEQHARRVFRCFREHGVEKIITVDPHSTNMLRGVYPEFMPEFDIEVQSYIEVLAGMDPECARENSEDVVIHDSCVYARYENMIDEPRYLLDKAGFGISEPELSGKLTHCCGGPVESLFPDKAREVASARVADLASCGNRIFTMCPICLLNLKEAAPDGVEVNDISELFRKAYIKNNCVHP